MAIVGSGFAGTLLAMIARRLGRSVILLERGTHPRIVVGESSTPLSNLLLEEMAARYHLPALQALTKWGSWQRSYPEIACGLKRGFTFYHHVHGQGAAHSRDRQDQLLVAASPRDEIADTHWYRADFDRLLVHEAQKCGVDYLDHVELDRVSTSEDPVLIEGSCNGRAIKLQARFLIDATGPRGFLHRAFGLRESAFDHYPATQSLHSHFTGVRRLDETSRRCAGERPPFPIDDAAVHHVFDGGWVWVLRFNNGVTSAGVVASDKVATELGFEDGDAAWTRVLDLLPDLKEQFAGATAIRSFTYVPRMSFRSSPMVGDNWALLPSAAGFVDPLLSTGIPIALLGVNRIAELIDRDWETDRFSEGLKLYAEITDRELAATARLIAALYANMKNFPLFIALTLLYFAAASFSETARRLGKLHLASSFLLCDDPSFGPAFARLTERARHALSKAESDRLIDDILAAIEPINVAGLGRSDRRNWYPVEADDLFESAAKLGVTRDDISEVLRRCGFATDSECVQ